MARNHHKGALWLCKEANYNRTDIEKMSFLTFLVEFDISYQEARERAAAMKKTT
jgi:hypothetical protein